MIKRDYIKIKVSDLKGYEKNNKKHGENVDEIVKSIQANTYIAPIIVDENNVILAGHGRKLALDKLGVEECDVLQVSGLSEEQKRDFRIRDNKLTELSEWDFENLKFELDELDIPDLSDLFKDEEELEEEVEAKEDDYEIPETITTDIVLGDLFEIGPHRLLCGDSTNIDDVNKLMNGEKADFGFCDPPYNLGFEYNSYDDNKTDEEYEQFSKDWFSNLSMYTDRQAITLGTKNIKIMANLGEPTGVGCWVKKNWITSCRIAKLQQWEPIFFFGDYTKYKRTTDLFEINREYQEDVGKNHTCPKQIKLIADILQNYSSKSVLDLFGGSGTTMVACHQLNRKCYMSELDPKYVQTIINRMIKLDPELTIKKNGAERNHTTGDYTLLNK